MPSGRRAANRAGPEKLLECANLSQRKRRYERRKDEDESNDGADEDEDEDEDEDDKEPAQKRKANRRGGRRRGACQVVPPKGTQYKEGHLKVITDWMSARDDFAEKLKRTVVRKCMADGECREQAMYVAIGCGNPLLEDIVLEEMRKW
ncbi:hypothetical protein LQV05_002243 [Cryptococcus neoformans]|nr:hypothetical protein LQV05_002243 [Cryptococcus neoformans]